jgi:hypothetical protein
MNVPQGIFEAAKNFQVTNNLDLSDIPKMLCHDAIHAILGLGVSTEEEELIEKIELVLEHGATWDAQALKLARCLPIELRNLYKFGNI